jgi:hypothetical protein
MKNHSLYSYMAIFNPKDPQPGFASQETSGSKVGNGSIESMDCVGKIYGKPWIFP